MGSLLSVEFVTELIAAFLAVFLLAQTRLASYAARVAFVTVIGIIAAISTNVSYWNWYGFPGDYTAAYIFIQFVGFLCVGLVAAWVLKNRPARATA
jgi:peptidoglycan/LPS O-acetylase OafA/YrhL